MNLKGKYAEAVVYADIVEEKAAEQIQRMCDYEIDGIRYVVVSHYTGKKDIDKVITELAEQRAYTEFGLSRS